MKNFSAEALLGESWRSEKRKSTRLRVSAVSLGAETQVNNKTAKPTRVSFMKEPNGWFGHVGPLHTIVIFR
jgi:hypothetical protein